jgi:hypothetical protein
MKTTFKNLGFEEEKVDSIRDKEADQQKSELEKKAAMRKDKQNSQMNVTGMNFNVIQDNFDGNMENEPQ